MWGMVNDGTQRWETSLKDISIRYLKGWFIIDVVSVAPFIFDILPLLDPDGGSSARGAKALRTIRALRLIKLLRLLRASKVFNRLKEYNSLPFTRMTLIKLSLQTVIISHSIACVVAIMTTLVDSPLDCMFALRATTVGPRPSAHVHTQLQCTWHRLTIVCGPFMLRSQHGWRHVAIASPQASTHGTACVWMSALMRRGGTRRVLHGDSASSSTLRACRAWVHSRRITRTRSASFP